MIDAFYDLLGLAYWLGIIAVVVWWIRSMRKAARPRARTPREEAELAALRQALDREHGTTGIDQAPAALSREQRT